MSSRRKSEKPVKRLDFICSVLQETRQPTSVSEAEWTPPLQDDVTKGTALLHEDNKVVDEGAQSDQMEEVLPVSTNPPEGVYILQPESVSDDEEVGEPKTENERSQKSTEVRKRSHVEDEEMEVGRDGIQQESYSGLDLSVKRPRIDGTSDAGDGTDFECANNNTPPYAQPSSLSPFVENSETVPDLRDQMEKYHHLMRLVAQQKPLGQALEEVGLSIHQFFNLHRLNTQLASSTIEKQGRTYVDDAKVTSAPPMCLREFEKFSQKEHISPTEMSVNDEWMTGKSQHDAKIQNLLKEAKEDVIQQQKQSSEAQQLNDSRLQQHPTTLNPTMAAALMASLASNPDQTTEERQTALRNIFYKARGALSQNSSPSLAMVPFNTSMDRSSSALKNDSITAGTVSSGVGSIKKGTLDPSNFDEDVFDQYIAKYTNMNRCGLLTCQYYTRDHYHCVVEDCNYQRFTNKADVIRHYNMHKKRDNSLAHGFLRFSPTEDCSSKYPNCHLNGKSTHYHCMQPDCNKVYTSTSDVMTHENFHKKYMQFVCSGFKRFRATEQCDLESCTFRNQKTTHFHCTRTDCNFTFKNKCDIEKHKTYHLRDDQYISKGFKKFYKNETCGFLDRRKTNYCESIRQECFL